MDVEMLKTNGLDSRFRLQAFSDITLKIYEKHNNQHYVVDIPYSLIWIGTGDGRMCLFHSSFLQGIPEADVRLSCSQCSRCTLSCASLQLVIHVVVYYDLCGV